MRTTSLTKIWRSRWWITKAPARATRASAGVAVDRYAHSTRATAETWGVSAIACFTAATTSGKDFGLRSSSRGGRRTIRPGASVGSCPIFCRTARRVRLSGSSGTGLLNAFGKPAANNAAFAAWPTGTAHTSITSSIRMCSGSPDDSHRFQNASVSGSRSARSASVGIL